MVSTKSAPDCKHQTTREGDVCDAVHDARSLTYVVPYSTVSEAHGNVKRGEGDVLVDNAPCSRMYHAAVLNGDGQFVYDLAAVAEPAGAITPAVDVNCRVALLRH